jgi:Nif-specific regulatory protein
VLEGQPFERVGGGKPIIVDVRVVAATNRDLEHAVRDGKFRQDLFFRLQVIEILAPPLREHPEDIPAIAQHFLERFARKSRVRVTGFNREAIELLKRHHWPGNVRELRNVVERAVILSDHQVLTPQDISLSRIDTAAVPAPTHPAGASVPSPAAAPGSSRESPQERPTEPGGQRRQPESRPDPEEDVADSPVWRRMAEASLTLDDIDRMYMQTVLEHCRWNKSNASKLLGIERTTLDRRLKRYGLERPGRDED